MENLVTGIVAEYNPLHKGHAYHIARTKEITGCTCVVAVLSSHFVQRGQACLIDKWTRTRMALMSGVDLVLELPVVFSCHNAGVFGNASVDLMARSGVIGAISFGMESPTPLLHTISDILIQEPEPFKQYLKSFLDKGHSFVKARSLALEMILPGSWDFLLRSNNNLALSYVIRIRKCGYPIRPVPIQRMGQNYHETIPGGPFASATAIRAGLKEHGLSSVSEYLHPDIINLLTEAAGSGRWVIDQEALWPMVKAILARSPKDSLDGFSEMSEGLGNRLMNLSTDAGSLEDLIGKAVTKRFPRGRIQRAVIHLLIGLDHWDNRAFQRIGPSYIRVLGATERGRHILRIMRKKATIPVITRASAPFSKVSGSIMDYEHRASGIWEILLERPETGKEKKSTPVML